MQFIFLVFRTPPPTTNREDLRVVLNGIYVPLFFQSISDLWSIDIDLFASEWNHPVYQKTFYVPFTSQSLRHLFAT